MREENTQDRLMIRMRTQFWDSLPTKAYRVRQLVRKQRMQQLDLGELEELELSVKRIADSAHSLGFEEVADIASSLAALLLKYRNGVDTGRQIDEHCDHLDQLIDDMTLEALAVGLRSLWHD